VRVDFGLDVGRRQSQRAEARNGVENSVQHVRGVGDVVHRRVWTVRLVLVVNVVDEVVQAHRRRHRSRGDRVLGVCAKAARVNRPSERKVCVEFGLHLVDERDEAREVPLNRVGCRDAVG